MSNIFLYDLGEQRDLPAHRLLHRGPGHHPALAGALLGARGRPAGVRVLREGQVRRLHHHQPARAEAPAVPAAPRRTAAACWRGSTTPPFDTTRSLQVREEVRPQVGEGGSIYRTPQGFRSSSEVARDRRHHAGRSRRSRSRRCWIRPTTACPTPASSRSRTTGCTSRPTTSRGRRSATRGTTSAAASSAARPISLSDILGNHQLVFAGYVNGRIGEAQVLAAYANLSQRINWAAGISQDPYYFLEPSEVEVDDPHRARTPSSPTSAGWWCGRCSPRPTTRSAGSSGSRRALRFANVDDALLSIKEPYDPCTGGFATQDPFLATRQPSRA